MTIADQPDVLQGRGRMAEAILAFDWSSTSIGPLGTWPISLRSVVQMAALSRQPICLFWGTDLNILYNDAYAPFLGLREADALGQPFRIIWSDIWGSIAPIVDEAMSGNGTWFEDLPLTMTRNGFEEPTYWSFSYSPLYDDTGKIAGLINIATETTAAVNNRVKLDASYDNARQQLVERHEIEARQQVIQREMAHRIKNILSMTMAVVSQTLRHPSSMETARDTISRRIAALAEAQDVLTNARFSEAEIGILAGQVLKPHVTDNARASISGPEVTVPAQHAFGMALALHELATNAVKYGALSNETGNVSLDWTMTNDGAFRMEWRESGGPEVQTPSRKGFGSSLMSKIVPSYFSGTGETFYEPSGFRYVLTGTVEQSQAS
ncbi:HWE histidine kinase domain-containing protein [uncultured Devosia sp.]|uniref:HWE histidine kinase domain-containing protein n=1 Tax=uncultured Devosia sp. TaxID=211434 RepID=UPI0035CBF2DB